MVNLLMVEEWAVFTLGWITLLDKKINLIIIFVCRTFDKHFGLFFQTAATSYHTFIPLCWSGVSPKGLVYFFFSLINVLSFSRSKDTVP